jgi:putative endonuclease
LNLKGMSTVDPAKNRKAKTHDKGLWAEGLASVFLTLRGYRIVARRYKTSHGEIDLIAARGDVLAIIEVKARGTVERALESVDLRTQRRIANATLMFLAEHPEYAGRVIRFDVIAVESPMRIVHLDNAWDAGP